MSQRKEIDEEWQCWYCGVDLGEHPRGIEITCPVCKKISVLPGINEASKKKSANLREIRERLKKEESLKRRSLRDQ